MDVLQVKDEINQVVERVEDREVLGLSVEHGFWESLGPLRARVAALATNEDLVEEWNALISHLDAENHWYVHTSNQIAVKPYRDEPEVTDDSNIIANTIDETTNNMQFAPYKDDSEDLMDNQQLFIHNTQLQDAHETQLDALHRSVKTQRHIAGTINDHLNEESIILGDLENQIERSRNRVGDAQTRLTAFNERSRNSPWLIREWLVIIVLLTVLLLLLKL